MEDFNSETTWKERHTNVKFEGVTLRPETFARRKLGVKIDNELRLNPHVLTIYKEANRKLSAPGRISNLIPFEQRKVLFNAFFESRFEYCPLVWMFHDRNAHHKINHLHERALRIV